MLSSFRHFDVVQEEVEPNVYIVTKLQHDFYQLKSHSCVHKSLENPLRFMFDSFRLILEGFLLRF